ncbi:MAG: hypothetical protein LBI48_10525 [Burkholderiaceae bacterium]|nr:hypothetical protein [Burkholderiaceae bacterium]
MPKEQTAGAADGFEGAIMPRREAPRKFLTGDMAGAWRSAQRQGQWGAAAGMGGK